MAAINAETPPRQQRVMAAETPLKQQRVNAETPLLQTAPDDQVSDGRLPLGPGAAQGRSTNYVHCPKCRTEKRNGSTDEVCQSCQEHRRTEYMEAGRLWKERREDAEFGKVSLKELKEFTPTQSTDLEANDLALQERWRDLEANIRVGIPPWLKSFPSILVTLGIPMYDQEVAKMADDTEGCQASITTANVSGPAAERLRKAFKVHIGNLLLFQVLVWLMSTSVDDDSIDVRGRQHVETPAWVALPFLLNIGYAKWHEGKCFQLMSIPLVQWAGPLKILGLFSDPVVFILFELIFTLLAGANRALQSWSFLQSHLSAHYCVGGNRMNTIWRTMPSLLPACVTEYSGLGDDPVGYFALMTLAAMWLEIIWIGMLTHPKSAVSYDLAKVGDKRDPSFKVLMSKNRCVYPPVYSKTKEKQTAGPMTFKMYTQDVVQYLASTVGMHSLHVYQTGYIFQRAWDPNIDTIRASHMVVMHVRLFVLKFMFKAVAGICALEVQVTLLGFHAHSPDPYHYQFIHTGLMILNAVLQLGDGAACLLSVFRSRKVIMARAVAQYGKEEMGYAVAGGASWCSCVPFFASRCSCVPFFCRICRTLFCCPETNIENPDRINHNDALLVRGLFYLVCLIIFYAYIVLDVVYRYGWLADVYPKHVVVA